MHIYDAYEYVQFNNKKQRFNMFVVVAQHILPQSVAHLLYIDYLFNDTIVNKMKWTLISQGAFSSHECPKVTSGWKKPWARDKDHLIVLTKQCS